ncbi:MAG: cytochrome P450 [Chloroflexi bacterium]|nr:cytochrome P450 [Chloroflexota bacterium]
MTLRTADAPAQQMTLPQELVLMLLNEESAYFRQVRGWNLNCAMVGAGLAELSLMGNIDTDMNSLQLLDSTPTGHAALDPILEAIAEDPAQHDAQYWVEVLAPRADTFIDVALDRLAEMDILQHHEGEFWTLNHSAWQSDQFGESGAITAAGFVRSRIARVIFEDEIPDPRDAILISLLNTCDVLRFIFELEPQADERVQFVSNLDLLGRSISDAVSLNLTSPLVRQSALTRTIPKVNLLKLLFNPHVRTGNIPARFASLAEQDGPVFQLAPPFQQPTIFLTGLEANRWAQREGRRFLTSTKYLNELEEEYGAHGIIPSLDSSDHFRMRKAMQPGLSRARLESQLGELYRLMRTHLAEWNVGDAMPARSMSRLMTNAQISPILASVDSQDIIEDLIAYKERALNTRVAKVMPKFLLRTPAIRQRAKSIEAMLERVQRAHTPALRVDTPRDIVDDLLSLHANDPQLLPESSLKFALSAPLLASMYLGDTIGFALYALASQPELYQRIQAEADAIFADGDPDPEVFQGPEIDVTRRFVLECLRMYPVVPGSLRNVMNSCVVENYELPLSARVLVVQTAAHYMSDVFPEPHKFDIDRYLPGREEHRSIGYAPFGLGTHTCLGNRWVELQMAVDLMMIAHYFDLEIQPANAKLRISPIPSLSISNKVKFHISRKRREIPPPGESNGSAAAMGCPVLH